MGTNTRHRSLNNKSLDMTKAEGPQTLGFPFFILNLR